MTPRGDGDGRDRPLAGAMALTAVLGIGGYLVATELGAGSRQRARDQIDVRLLPAVNPVVEVSRVEKTSEGSVRIGSARGDLTGQGLRLIAADDGEPAGHGGVRCSRRVRFGGKAAIRAMPATIICWRTSPERSVVTVAVAAQGRPSTATSLAIIDREWAKLEPQ